DSHDGAHRNRLEPRCVAESAWESVDGQILTTTSQQLGWQLSSASLYSAIGLATQVCRLSVAYESSACPCDFLLNIFPAPLLPYRAGFHEEDFPNVPIEILEAVPVHEAMVLRLVVSVAAGGNRLTNCLVDLVAGIAG